VAKESLEAWQVKRHYRTGQKGGRGMAKSKEKNGSRVVEGAARGSNIRQQQDGVAKKGRGDLHNKLLRVKAKKTVERGTGGKKVIKGSMATNEKERVNWGRI